MNLLVTTLINELISNYETTA